MSEGTTYKLRVWRQAGPDQPGKLVDYSIGNVIGGVFMVGLAYWFIYLRPDWAAENANKAVGDS